MGIVRASHDSCNNAPAATACPSGPVYYWTVVEPDAPELSIVTPAHNEEAGLSILVPVIVAVLGEERHEIIVVDDGSTDGTWNTILAFRRRFPQVVGVRLTRNFGHQAALLAGLSASRGAAVITLDADGQHPPNRIPELVAAWRKGASIVQGVRTETENESRLKRLTSRAFYRVLAVLGGPPLPSGAADFRLLARQAVDEVLRSAGPLLFLRGLVPWLGFPTVEVSFAAKRRLSGKTKYTWWRMLRFSVHGLLSFSLVPLRAAMLGGFVIAVFALLYLVFVIVAWLTMSAVVSGWASVMGLVALLGGIQLITIGVLGEYVGRTFTASLNRPHFVVREHT